MPSIFSNSQLSSAEKNFDKSQKEYRYRILGLWEHVDARRLRADDLSIHERLCYRSGRVQQDGAIFRNDPRQIKYLFDREARPRNDVSNQIQREVL